MKATPFAGLALRHALPQWLPKLWRYVDRPLTALTYFRVYLALALCITRGAPVIAEFVYTQRHDILRRPGAKQ